MLLVAAPKRKHLRGRVLREFRQARSASVQSKLKRGAYSVACWSQGSVVGMLALAPSTMLRMVPRPRYAWKETQVATVAARYSPLPRSGGGGGPRAARGRGASTSANSLRNKRLKRPSCGLIGGAMIEKL
jgi:hypothetical protein